MTTIVALMYHDVYKKSSKESGFQNDSAIQYKLSACEFEKQVQAISKYCKEHNDVEVEFTFDDGGVSFLDVCAPILEKYNQKGIFFIATKFINTPLFLNSNELEELHKRGHIIGSHSHSHKEMSKLRDDEIDTEWEKSVEMLRPLMSDGICASIPNGDSRAYVESSAERHGVKRLYTSVPSTKFARKGNMDLIGRYVVYQEMTTENVMSLIVCPSKRRRMYLKWSVLRIVKAVLGNQYSALKSKLFKK